MANSYLDPSELPAEILDNLYSGENALFCIKKQVPVELKPKYLIITDHRVLFLDQKILGRYDLSDIPYSKLERVFFEEGILASEFKLKDEDNHIISINWLQKGECRDAIITIRDAINAIAIEPVSIKRKKNLMSEKWILTKPKENITRSMPMVQRTEYRAPVTMHKRRAQSPVETTGTSDKRPAPAISTSMPDPAIENIKATPAAGSVPGLSELTGTTVKEPERTQISLLSVSEKNHPAPTPAPQSSHDGTDIVARLKTLKELKDIGILTDEEYEQKRKQLIEHL